MSLGKKLSRPGDFSRWLFGVFANRELGGEITDLRQAIEKVTVKWYGA
jgi:hypothetical protein